MSSLRNAVKRKTHKERSQPSFRKRHGFLEKKQDYILRARDYSSKRQRIRALKQKASFRNPDEFYFGMINSRTKNGIHALDRKQLSEDEIKLIRSQNAAYLLTLNSAEAESLRRSKGSLHFVGEQPKNKHIIFCDSAQEAKAFDKAKHFDTIPELTDRVYNRPTKEMLRSQPLFHGGKELDDEDVEQQLQAVAESREKAYRRLYERLERHKKMKNVLAHVNTYKNLEGKGQRRKVREAEDGKPPVYLWKQERKK